MPELDAFLRSDASAWRMNVVDGWFLRFSGGRLLFRVAARSAARNEVTGLRRTMLCGCNSSASMFVIAPPRLSPSMLMLS